jgi:RNA polymerase-binding transcription factor DksA
MRSWGFRNDAQGDMLNSMEQKNLGEYKQKLEARKKALLAEVKADSTPESFGNDVDAESEKTDEAEEEGNRRAAAAALREDLSEIESALEKIGRGTYGVCEQCGASIESEVLATAPESALCRSCKKKE